MPEKIPSDKGTEIALLISGLLALLDYAEPKIRDAMASGDITADDQQKLKDKIDSLRSGGGFDDPAWKPSDSSAPPSPS